MNKKLLGLLVGSTLAFGCASDADSPSDVADDEVSVSTAFYGLTVMDCQAQATQCLEDSRRGLFSLLRRPVTCSVQLSACLTEATVQAAGSAVTAVAEVTSCGTQGVSCIADANDVASAIACQEHVEGCVIDTVNEHTGIELPTTREVVEAAAGVVGEVVETAVEVTEEVVETAVNVTGEVIETAVEVTEEVVETAVDTATTVVTETVETAGEVVETAVGVVNGAVDCAAQSRQCWRDTRNLLSCQRQYNACLRAL